MSARTAATNDVINASLRVISSHYAEPHAHFDAETDYAWELLALAARDLTRAVDALEDHEKPVGW